MEKNNKCLFGYLNGEKVFLGFTKDWEKNWDGIIDFYESDDKPVYERSLEDLNKEEYLLVIEDETKDFINYVNRYYKKNALKNKTIITKKEFYKANFEGNCIMPKVGFIDLKAFFNSNFSGTLYIPRCSYISNAAFYNSNFSKIIIGKNVFLDFYCIGAHSDEFIRDYQANKKLAGRYIFDGERWIYKP